MGRIVRATVIASLLVVLAKAEALAGGGRGGGGRGGGGGGGRPAMVRTGGYGGGGPRVVVHHTPAVRVQPAYVGVNNRPYVRERYYDRNRRPTVIVENYGRRPGYYWVQGNYDWDGREWVWYPGHYEPDPAYGGQVRVYNGGY